jgi:hypothetical protein
MIEQILEAGEGWGCVRVGGVGEEVALVVVDAANVVGSVPDGWWRDRHGATERLRDALVAVAAAGLPGVDARLTGPVEVVLVVEGKARAVTGLAEVRVVAAPGAGDDTIVDLVRGASANRVRAVVTADRVLRARVTDLGALVLGPRAVRPAS